MASISAPVNGGYGYNQFGANQRPFDWDPQIYRHFPFGNSSIGSRFHGNASPIIIALSRLGVKTVDDAQHYWWEKDLATFGGAITNIFIDSGLSTAYVRASHQSVQGVTGGTVYIQAAADVINSLSIGQDIQIRDTSRNDAALNATVVGKAGSGAGSYTIVQLLEDDDNSADPTNFSMETGDFILGLANARPEMGAAPEQVTFNPVERLTYVQTQIDKLEITQHVLDTMGLRTGPQLEELQMELLQNHLMNMEYATWFGQGGVSIGNNGHNKYRTKGILQWINEDADAVKSDFTIDAAYSGKTWIQSGWDWLLAQIDAAVPNLEPGPRMAVAGQSALIGLSAMASAIGNIQLVPSINEFGMNTQKLILPSVELDIITHPLFNRNANDRNRLLFGSLQDIDLVSLRSGSTKWLFDPRYENGEMPKNGGSMYTDGRTDLLRTQFGVKFRFPKKWVSLNGVGKDNTV